MNFYKAKFDVYCAKTGKLLYRKTVRNEYDFNKLKEKLKADKNVKWDVDIV